MVFFSFKKNKKGKRSTRPICSVVIAAAGSSSRMGGEDKQFAELCGVPALAHTLYAFERCELVSEIIVVTRDSEMERVRDLCSQYCIDKAVWVIAGGETRLLSVMNGVMSAQNGARLIAVHDGARPCVTQKIISRAILSAKSYHAAAPAVPVSSTIKLVEDGMIKQTVDRASLYEIQTPQVFDADLLKAALAAAKTKEIDVTDDCMAVELLGVPVHITEGTRENIKLTTREDIALAELIMSRREKRLFAASPDGDEIE